MIYHIQRSLPELKSRIEAEIADREKELNHYGKPPTITKAEKGAYLLNLISRFSNSFCDAIDGKAQHAQLGELHGGARISYIFHNVFDSRLMQIDPFEHLTDKEVRAAIRNASVSNFPILKLSSKFSIFHNRVHGRAYSSLRYLSNYL